MHFTFFFFSTQLLKRRVRSRVLSWSQCATSLLDATKSDTELIFAILSDWSWETSFVIALSQGHNSPETPDTPLWFSEPQNCWLAGKTIPLPCRYRPSFLSHFIPSTHRTESAIITWNLRVATHTLCLHSYTTPMGPPSGPLKQDTEYWLQVPLLLAPSLSLI